jgi:ADP-ribosylglycohydrolase
VAEEALAIGVYCALAAGDDFAAGLRLAVNHGGDSDSTGSIAGNLLGTLLGVQSIPADWLAGLELRREITELADDLLTEFRPDDEWWQRYPGW